MEASLSCASRARTISSSSAGVAEREGGGGGGVCVCVCMSELLLIRNCTSPHRWWSSWASPAARLHSWAPTAKLRPTSTSLACESAPPGCLSKEEAAGKSAKKIVCTNYSFVFFLSGSQRYIDSSPKKNLPRRWVQRWSVRQGARPAAAWRRRPGRFRWSG